MKKITAILAFSIAASTCASAGTLYWDPNDVTPGAGGTLTGSWDSAFWSTDASGSSATSTWVAGETAVFSAGFDAGGAYAISLPSAQSVGGISFEEGTVTVTGSTLTVAADGEINVASGLSATISSIIAGTKWTKSGSGTLILTANNTFTNGITINGGVVQFNGEGTATAGAATPTGAIPSTVQANFITLNGGTLRSTRAGLGVTFLATNKGITLGATGGTLEVANLNGTDFNIYAGVITGGGDLIKDGAGILAFTGAHTYTGRTIINAGEIRIRTTADRLPTTTAVTVNSVGKLNLNGVSQKIGSLSGSGIVGLGSGTLTVGDATNTTFSGTLVNVSSSANGGVASGSGKVTKIGSGTLTLSGLNTYTGTFTLSGGTVIVDPSGLLCGAICDIVVNGGTLSLNNAAQTIENLNGTGGTISLGNGHTLTINPVSNATYSGVITGAGGVTKTSALTETLAGSNTYTGPTIVGAGTLLVSGSLVGTSGVSVSGTLSGGGSIVPAVGTEIVILAGGKLAPATSTTSAIGTLAATFSGGATLDISAGVAADASGALVFDLGTVESSDKVTLSGGALKIGTGVLGFDDFAFTTTASFQGEGDYVLFDGSLPIIGTLTSTVSGFIGGVPAELTLGDGGNDLVLHVIPEPSSAALLTAGILLLGRIRRRSR